MSMRPSDGMPGRRSVPIHHVHEDIRAGAPKPKRIQLKRTKGWKMPENTVKVTRPGKWGNSFRVGAAYEDVVGRKCHVMDAEHAVSLYRPIAWTRRDEIVRELRGKNLACWCPDGAACHADVLLEIANK